MLEYITNRDKVILPQVTLISSSLYRKGVCVKKKVKDVVAYNNNTLFILLLDGRLLRNRTLSLDNVAYIYCNTSLLAAVTYNEELYFYDEVHGWVNDRKKTVPIAKIYANDRNTFVIGKDGSVMCDITLCWYTLNVYATVLDMHSHAQRIFFVTATGELCTYIDNAVVTMKIPAPIVMMAGDKFLTVEGKVYYIVNHSLISLPESVTFISATHAIGCSGDILLL